MSRRSNAKRALPANLHALASELVRRAAQAAAASERSGGPPDYLPVVELLREHPALLRYLDGVRERAAATANALTRPDLALAAPTASTPQDQWGAAWAGNRNQPIGVANSRLLREWADTNEWVRAAINVRRIQVGRADIMVTPADVERPYDKQLMQRIQRLLDQPNELRDSYRSLIEPVIEDVLVLDRGVISKSMTPGKERVPTALYAEDGATIKIFPAWSGDPREPRYLYEEPASNRRVPLLNDEAIVIMANPATYRYGRSPVEVLQNTIRADLQATKSAMQMVDMKPPPHLIQLPGVSATTLERIRASYEADVAGRREILFMNGPSAANVVPLVFSAKDNQWLEWQEYLARKIATVFQISPQQLGLTFDINRATAQQQQEIFEDTGLIPLLLLLEEFLNRELLDDFAPTLDEFRADNDALNLCIIYPEISEASRQMHAERAIDFAAKGLAGLPSMTLNQVLAMRGEKRVVGGNTFWALTGQNIIPLASYDNNLGVYADVMIGDQNAAAQSGGDQGGTQLMDPPKPKDETPGKRRVPKPADGTGSGTAEGTPPNFQDETPTKDWRRPGKSWRPAHLNAPALSTAALHSRPHDEETARRLLRAGVRRIFEDTARRTPAPR